jgi:DNA-binding PadR family transcriptional regulator
MEQNGWISSEWGVMETNRKAKYYRLTPDGRKHVRKAEQDFADLVSGIFSVLKY